MTDVPYRELFVPQRSADSRLVVAYMLNSASGGRRHQEGLPGYWPGLTRDSTGRDGPVEATR